MGYQENPDHIPDPTAHYGTMDTTGDHSDASRVSGVWDVARDAAVAGLNYSDEDTYSDADREKLAGEQEAAAERSEQTGRLIVPNPVPEGTIHMDDVLSPQEQAQRLDPDVPDPLVDRAREQGYDVPDDAYRGNSSQVSDAVSLDGPAEAPEDPTRPPEVATEPLPPEGQVVAGDGSEGAGQFNPSDHTVEEVNAYLTSDISDEEAERVLTAERAGKARKGVVGE